MEQESLPTEEKKKPGPKPKDSKVEELETKVEKLTAVIEHLASLTGNGNMLPKYGLKRWIPGQDDMRKYKG